MNKHKNATFKLCNKIYLDENKIQRNLKVMFMHVFTNNFEYVVGNNSLLSTSPTYAKADTGVYRTFIKTVHISHLKNVEKLQPGSRVLLSNNEALIASHQGTLQFNDCLTDTTKTTSVLPGMTNKSLLCDNNCIAIFSKNI